MGELDPKIKIRAPLRCEGIGRLDCAEDTESGKRLAVRWLPLEANAEAAVKACEKLPQHPALPQILQTGAVGSSAFVAMDFPEGRVLSAVEEDFDIRVVLRMAAQVSEALALIHEQNVVHGELSADSILLVPESHAYLWDMPLVIANRMTDRRGESRLMQKLPRTAAFLSPERACGSGASAASDVYALGAVLCAAAGAPQPTAETTLGVVHMIGAGDWTPRVPNTIPEPWRGMIGRMVARSASERPTAREIATLFASTPPPQVIPTLPEMPVVRLPPELMAAEEALARRPHFDEPPVEPGAAVAADAALVAEPIQPLEILDPAAEVGIVASGVVAPGTSVSSESIPVVVTDCTLPLTEAAAPSSLPTVEMPAVQLNATVEMPAVQMNQLVSVSQASSLVTEAVVPPAPTMTHAPSSAVVMTDSVMVSPELANAGAVALTAEQFAELSRPPKWIYAAGGAMLAAILALLVVAINLAAKQGAAIRAAEAAAVRTQEERARVPPTSTPVNTIDVQAQVPEEDELAPIPRVKRAPVQRGFDMPERASVRGPTEM